MWLSNYSKPWAKIWLRYSSCFCSRVMKFSRICPISWNVYVPWNLNLTVPCQQELWTVEICYRLFLIGWNAWFKGYKPNHKVVTWWSFIGSNPNYLVRFYAWHKGLNHWGYLWRWFWFIVQLRISTIETTLEGCTISDCSLHRTIWRCVSIHPPLKMWIYILGIKKPGWKQLKILSNNTWQKIGWTICQSNSCQS